MCQNDDCHRPALKKYLNLNNLAAVSFYHLLSLFLSVTVPIVCKVWQLVSFLSDTAAYIAVVDSYLNSLTSDLNAIVALWTASSELEQPLAQCPCGPKSLR